MSSIMLSPPPDEFVEQLSQIVANQGWPPFKDESMALVASALTAISFYAPAKGVNMEAFILATLHSCHVHRDNISICMIAAQERWLGKNANGEGT